MAEGYSKRSITKTTLPFSQIMIKSDLLEEGNFPNKLLELGYKHFRIEGDGQNITCWLWYGDDLESSIKYSSSSIELAVGGALAAANAFKDFQKERRKNEV
jgi:hypothetical protein